MKNQLFIIVAALLLVQISCKTINGNSKDVVTQTKKAHAQQLLKQLQETANENNDRTINDCIEAGEYHVEILLNTTLDNITQCGVEDTAALEAVVNEAIENVRILASELEELWPELEDCDHNVICIGLVTIKIVKKVLEYPAIIIKAISGIEGIISNSTDTIKECVEGVLDDARVQGNVNIYNIIECIKNEIIN